MYVDVRQSNGRMRDGTFIDNLPPLVSVGRSPDLVGKVSHGLIDDGADFLVLEGSKTVLRPDNLFDAYGKSLGLIEVDELKWASEPYSKDTLRVLFHSNPQSDFYCHQPTRQGRMMHWFTDIDYYPIHGMVKIRKVPESKWNISYRLLVQANYSGAISHLIQGPGDSIRFYCWSPKEPSLDMGMLSEALESPPGKIAYNFDRVPKGTKQLSEMIAGRLELGYDYSDKTVELSSPHAYGLITLTKDHIQFEPFVDPRDYYPTIEETIKEPTSKVTDPNIALAFQLLMRTFKEQE